MFHAEHKYINIFYNIFPVESNDVLFTVAERFRVSSDRKGMELPGVTGSASVLPLASSSSLLCCRLNKGNALWMIHCIAVYLWICLSLRIVDFLRGFATYNSIYDYFVTITFSVQFGFAKKNMRWLVLVGNVAPSLRARPQMWKQSVSRYLLIFRGGKRKVANYSSCGGTAWLKPRLCRAFAGLASN